MKLKERNRAEIQNTAIPTYVNQLVVKPRPPRAAAARRLPRRPLPWMYAESERIAASPPGKLYAANGCAHFAVEMIPRVPPHPIGGVLATPLSRVCGRRPRRGGGGRVRSSEDGIFYNNRILF